MKRAVLVGFVGIAFLFSPLLIAQTAMPAAGGAQAPPAAPPKSTALILGRVVDGTTGQPIAEAVVSLSQGGGARGNAQIQAGAGASPEAQQAMQAAIAAAAAAAGRGPGGPQRVMTGADGRFVFHDLLPGPYQLTATLSGYTSSLNVGPSSGIAGLIAVTMSGGAPTSVVLKEGQFATGLKMRLWKNAVVSGVVQDDAGEPAIGLTVQVARRVMSAGRARYIPGTSARTDDRGLYRVTGLVPGDYLVVVPQTQVSIPTAILTGLVDSLTSGGGLGGGGLALMDVISSGINPTEAMAGGVRIGDFMVASSGSVPLLGADGRLQAYQTVFYSGAQAPALATVVSLKSGEDRNNVNFQLSLISTSRVSGTALGPDGPVANLGVRLVVPGDGLVSESEFDVATAVTKPDGTFAFYGVPPGQFLLRANKQPRPEMPAEMMAAPAMQMLFGPGGVKGSPDMLFAVANVNVAGGDVDGLALQLTPGFRVSGRVEFQSQGTRPQPTTAQLQNVTVTLTPMDGRGPGGLLGDLGGPDRANAQSEFRTKGYAPGRYFLTVSGPGGWLLKSATIGGRDVLDAPLEIKEDVSGIVATFTDKLGALGGTVTGPGETDMSETTVLLFPANYKSWIDNGMNPRRSRNARASVAGAFNLANLPAGDYLAAALDRSNEGDMQDPAFVDALARVATKVTVGADAVTLNLTKVRVAR